MTFPSYCFIEYVLSLDKFYASLEELIECFALQHAVLQECEVNELMDNSVVSSKTAEDVVLLVLLLLDSLLGFSLHVLVVLCQFVVLLLVLLLLDGGETGFLTLELRDDGLQSLFCR